MSFKGQGSTLAIESRQQCLGQDSLQDKGELSTNLLLLIGRKNIDDTINRLHRAVSVQGSKTEVTGFSNTQGRLDRFQIT